MISQWQPPERPSRRRHTTGAEDDLLAGSWLERATALMLAVANRPRGTCGHGAA